MAIKIKKSTFKTVDEYLKTFPPPVRLVLEKIRNTIRSAAPGAEEMISYGIPGYKYQGMLIYFAGFKNHVSVYPAPRSAEEFKKELSTYEGGKGTVQFPLGKPVPLDLVRRIVRFRMKVNEVKAGLKKNKAPSGKKQVQEKPADAERVKDWISHLAPPVRKEIETVRKLIKAGSAKLGERIKWNAPSYYYRPGGKVEQDVQDIVTFGPYRDEKILLVFHHPAVVKVKSSLLEGNFKDRRLVYFKDGKEASKQKKELGRIISEITRIIDKK